MVNKLPQHKIHVCPDILEFEQKYFQRVGRQTINPIPERIEIMDNYLPKNPNSEAKGVIGTMSVEVGTKGYEFTKGDTHVVYSDYRETVPFKQLTDYITRLFDKATSNIKVDKKSIFIGAHRIGKGQRVSYMAVYPLQHLNGVASVYSTIYDTNADGVVIKRHVLLSLISDGDVIIPNIFDVNLAMIRAVTSSTDPSYILAGVGLSILSKDLYRKSDRFKLNINPLELAMRVV